MRPPAAKPASARSPRSPLGLHNVLLAIANVIAVVGAGVLGVLWLFAPSWELLGQLGSFPLTQPTRVYGQPPQLQVGDRLELRELVAELQRQGYRPAPPGEPPATGRFRLLAGETLLVGARRSPTPGGFVPPRLVEVRVRAGRVEALRSGGQPVSAVALEPPLLAALSGPQRLERRPVTLADLNNDLVRAVLAAEDDGFFQHTGLSLSGVLRALVVDLRGGEIRQGGSTITQQLARNLFLSHERTVVRKLREAALAVALELELSKWQILETYLNVVYLGMRDGVSIVGVGAAARAYFGKDARELSLAEAAALAGMIASPGTYSPLLNPRRCQTRRDWVLRRLAELGWAEPQQVEQALAQPVDPAPEPVAPRVAPYFVEAVRREVEQRWGVRGLEDQGYSVLTTLVLADQRAAETAVVDGLAALEGGRRDRRPPLQVALVSLRPATGGILAYVGGRDWWASQFDRAGVARRPPGSAFKPVVYAAALARGNLTPASLLQDSPLSLVVGGRTWTPQNDDGEFAGVVSVRRALEDSRNVPAVRVALATGLQQVVEQGRRLGITSPLEPLPALALGAFALSPLELATVYGSFAAGGQRLPTHGVTAVLAANGVPLPRPTPLPPSPALSPEVAFLVTSLLQGVIDRGTGRGVRAAGLADPLAGKTGTSNEQRDAWFAGYAAERATVVWVGYDDNSPVEASGARAALPIWVRFTKATRPPGGYTQLPRPARVVKGRIDPASGLLATSRCPVTADEYFLAGQAPEEACPLHAGWRARPLPQEELPTPRRRSVADRLFRRR